VDPARMGEVTLKERQQNADAYLEHMASFIWPTEFPERPAGLLYDDLELWTAHRKGERGEKLNREEREQLNMLSVWVGAVYGLEALSQGRLQTSIGVLTTLEASERWDDVRRVRAHIYEQWRCTLPVPALPTYLDWTRRFCVHFSKNYRLVPMHLRRMTRPPEGAYTKPVAAQQTSIAYAEEDE
jgi:hypothetical protein